MSANGGRTGAIFSKILTRREEERIISVLRRKTPIRSEKKTVLEIKNAIRGENSEREGHLYIGGTRKQKKRRES